MMQTKANFNSVALFSCLLEQLAQAPVMLAIVTATQGTVATNVGDKLLVWGDAQRFGSLGDSGLDTAVITQSFAVLKTGIAQRMVLDADGVEITTETTAGHQVQVWLTRWQGEDAIAMAQATLMALDSSASNQLIVPLVTGQFPYITGPDAPSLRNLQGQNAYIEEL